MDRFNEIKSRDDLAEFLKVPLTKLNYVLYVKKVENCYAQFEIPKKSGGVRQISAPNTDLKEIQVKLAAALTAHQDVIWKENGITPTLSHAFQKDKGIITNACIHRNKRYVLNYDLKDFFPSIHFGRIVGFFEKNKFWMLPHKVAIVIAQLACYQSALPQGAPTSPVISNLVCQVLDIRLLKLAKEYRLDFTRYADDLTFSTNDKSFLDRYAEFDEKLSALINKTGFQLNLNKTRLQYRNSRQEVTGLIVNKKLNVDRRYYKTTRAMAYSLYTTGKYSIGDADGTLNQLEGRFSFIDQLDRYNNRNDGQTHNCHKLCGHEQQYQAFLFYKNFFANTTPTVITEGNTDILYLKAALIKYCKKYPSLVSKNEDGKYTFHFSFFNKTRHWSYFYGLSSDGGDAMKVLYYCYTKGHNYPDYWTYFTKLNPGATHFPIICLLDNEAAKAKDKNAPKKPLHSLLNTIGANEVFKTTLQNDLYIPLVEKSNLFLLINPLVDGKKECEIEDLFTEETLKHKIDGKEFRRDVDCKNTNFYGKAVFAQYIIGNWENIDFSRFVPLLDALNHIVTTYNDNSISDT